MEILNNKGWSLSTMIIFVVVLIFVVLIVSILVYHVDHDKNSSNPIFRNHEVSMNYIFKEEDYKDSDFYL